MVGKAHQFGHDRILETMTNGCGQHSSIDDCIFLVDSSDSPDHLYSLLDQRRPCANESTEHVGSLQSGRNKVNLATMELGSVIRYIRNKIKLGYRRLRFDNI